MRLNLAAARLQRLTAGLPRTYWVLWSGTLLNRLGTFVVPFLTLYLTAERGLPLSRAAFIVSVYGGGAFLANLVGGLLADHVGRRATMAAGLMLGAVTMAGLAFARPFALIAVVAGLLGFFTDLYRPAVSAAVADLVAPAHRVRAYGLMYWAINLGAAIAPVLAGFLAGRAYVLLFLLDALTMLVYGCIILAFVPETKPPAAAEAAADTGPGLGRRLAVLVQEPYLLAFAVLAFLFSCVFFQCIVTLPIDMQAHGLTEADYGLVIAANGTLIVLLSIPVSHWVERFARLRVLAVASLLLGVGFGLTGLVETVPLYAATVIVWTMGELLMAPVAPSVVADLAPEHLRGRYQGLYGAAWGLASLVGPALGGYVFEHAGPGILWAGCFAVGLALVAGYLALDRPLHRHLERLRLQRRRDPAGAGAA